MKVIVKKYFGFLSHITQTLSSIFLFELSYLFRFTLLKSKLKIIFLSTQDIRSAYTLSQISLNMLLYHSFLLDVIKTNYKCDLVEIKD